MSLISTYQSRKSLFAEKLITKGVEASATDGLTTLINKIGDISTCNNGLLFAVDKTIAQSGGTVNLSAMILKDGIFQVGETVNFYTGDVRTLGETHGLIDLGGNAWKLSIETLDTMVQFGADQVVITRTNDGYNITDAYQQHTYDLEGDYVCFDGTNLVLYNDVDSCDISDFDDIDTWESNIINDIGYYPYPPATVHIEVLLTAVTGSNGVASVQYSCSGSGLKNFYATSGSLVSEQYAVLDCEFYDIGTTGTPNSEWWKSSGITLTSGDTGLTATNDSSNTHYLSPNKVGTSKSQLSDLVEWDDFACEFTYHEHSGSIFLETRDSNNQINQRGFGVINPSEGDVIKIVYTGNTLKYYKNDVKQGNDYTDCSGDVMIRFSITNGSIRFSNFKVYPI